MLDNDRLWDYVIATIFAVLGGLAKLLGHKDATQISWTTIVSELFIAGFVGLMTLQAGIAMGIENAWLGVACGAAGFMGVRVMNGLIALLSKKTGIDLTEKKEEESK